MGKTEQRKIKKVLHPEREQSEHVCRRGDPWGGEPAILQAVETAGT